jgi:alanine dehydrogenase
MTRILVEAQVEALLTPERAEALVTTAFELMARGEAVNYTRQRGGQPGALINVMWAVAPTVGCMAVKVYPVTRLDVSQAATATLLLYDIADGSLAGLVEAERLGLVRTGGASAVATRLLARSDSRILSVIGTGYQALGQVIALAPALPQLANIKVAGRCSTRANRFAETVESQTGIPTRVCNADEATEVADVLVTATGSSTPVVRGELLRPGVHINAVGSNYSTKRELDGSAMLRADVIAVDSFAAAAEECGDLLANGLPVEDCVELGDVLIGKVPGRTHRDQITIFESQGLAMFDLVCGWHLLHETKSDAAVLEVLV